MIQSFSVLFLQLSLFIGATVYLIWWIIGKPDGMVGRPEESTVDVSNILSFYGKWVIKRFNRFEFNENQRLSAIFNDKMNRLLADKNGTLGVLKDVVNEEAYKKEEARLESEIQRRAAELNTSINREHRRLNPYKSLGACLTCFAVWVSLLILTSLFLMGILPVQKITIVFGFFCLTLSVLVSKLFSKYL